MTGFHIYIIFHILCILFLLYQESKTDGRDRYSIDNIFAVSVLCLFATIFVPAMFIIVTAKTIWFLMRG